MKKNSWIQRQCGINEGIAHKSMEQKRKSRSIFTQIRQFGIGATANQCAGKIYKLRLKLLIQKLIQNKSQI